MLCFPLDNTEYEAEGLGLEHVTRSRGVFAADDNLRVSAGGGMNVTISPGICFLKMGEYWGVTALQKAALSLPIQTADGTLTRKDAIVARIDKVANLAEIVVKPGTPASSPELPAIVRDDDYDEIYLASVTVGAGVVEITNAAISDLRLDETVCGLMVDTAAKIPTQALADQWAAFWAYITADAQAEGEAAKKLYAALYEEMKDLIADAPAAKLQLEIDTARGLIDKLTAAVEAGEIHANTAGTADFALSAKAGKVGALLGAADGQDLQAVLADFVRNIEAGKVVTAVMTPSGEAYTAADGTAYTATQKIKFL